MEPAGKAQAPIGDRRATAGHAAVPARLRYERLLPLAVSIFALLAALWGGLLRLSWSLPVVQSGLYISHGPLMVCGFLGTMISLERAVALGESWSYASPALSGADAVALIAGAPDLIGAALITRGSIGLIANFAAIVYHQTALFTIIMALGAAAWFAGNCIWLAGIPVIEMFYWWTAFLVLTIVGERLGLSRLTGLADQNRRSFVLSTAPFIAGLVIARQLPETGLRLAGIGMLAIALWLVRYDLARRTVKQTGLTHFIAVNLLAGYIWLGAG